MRIIRTAVVFVTLLFVALTPVSVRAACNSPLPPIVTWIFPFSQVTPGGGVILFGNNFGDKPGKFEILLTNYKGTPVSFELQNLTWADHGISGVIPDYVFEVVNQ